MPGTALLLHPGQPVATWPGAAGFPCRARSPSIRVRHRPGGPRARRAAVSGGRESCLQRPVWALGPVPRVQLAWLLAHSEAAEAGGGLGVESQRPRPLGRPPSGGPRFPRGRQLHSSHILHPQSISQNSGGVCPAWWFSGVGTARPGSGPRVHPLQSGCRCPEGAGLVLWVPDTRPAGVSWALQRDAHGARL